MLPSTPVLLHSTQRTSGYTLVTMSSPDAERALPVYEFEFPCEEDFQAMRPLDKEGRVRCCDACEKNV